jgi:hypothetical protein
MDQEQVIRIAEEYAEVVKNNYLFKKLCCMVLILMAYQQRIVI